jgi:hypothetical protein
MDRNQEIAEIEESLRRAAEAIRRGDPDALAGRASLPNRGAKRPKSEKPMTTVKAANKALG